MSHTKLRLLVASPALIAVLACGDEPTWRETRELVHSTFPEVAQLTVDELAGWLEDDQRPPPLLLDVRAAEEFEVSHLAGARRAEPGGRDLDRVLDGVPPDQPIVAYCSVGYRSSEVVRLLMERGHTRVYNLDGSIFEWANHRRPVVRTGVEVREVHPFDEQWGALLDADLHRYSTVPD